MRRSGGYDFYADCVGDPGLGMFLQQTDPLVYYALFPNAERSNAVVPDTDRSLLQLLWHKIKSQFRTGAATLPPRAQPSPTPALTALPSDPSPRGAQAPNLRRQR